MADKQEDKKEIESQNEKPVESVESGENTENGGYEREEQEENTNTGEEKNDRRGRLSSQTIDEIDDAKERENLRKLEAVFFVSGRFLTMQDLISLSDLNPILIRELIDKLQKKYDTSNSAIQIVRKNNMWKMDVKDEFRYLINKLATGQSEFSKAEKETLALIAYKQPIKQSVIVKIRGNKSYDHIKKFVDLGFIEKKKEGHTHILSLSEEFYDYFALEPSEGGDESEKEKTRNTLKMAEQYINENEEGTGGDEEEKDKENEKNAGESDSNSGAGEGFGEDAVVEEVNSGIKTSLKGRNRE